jgi:hypothetical protein
MAATMAKRLAISTLSIQESLRNTGGYTQAIDEITSTIGATG